MGAASIGANVDRHKPLKYPGGLQSFAPKIRRHVAARALATGLVLCSIGIGATTAAASCLSLSALSLPDTLITAAQSITAGTYIAPDGTAFPNLPTFCRIAATLTPTPDSNIKIEVWMPYSGWNGRYVGTGNGNTGGLIDYLYLSGVLGSGSAVANTDMGTSPAATDPLGSRVLTGHPEKQIDFATRSTHLMTVRAKQIIEAFYGEPPRFSYFIGCSTGGGQAVHEALQFPSDYDGITASAPAINRTHQHAGLVWDYVAFNRNPVHLTATQETAITAAVVKQCAGRDGGLSSDNFLTDPGDCHWDPASLQCSGNAVPSCLTAPQVVAMRQYYQGPVNPRTGERILAGRVLGSESNGRGGPVDTEARPRPDVGVPYWVFGNSWDWRTFDFDRDMDTIDEALAATLNVNTADLDEFKLRGGKLILIHGFADPLIPTLNTIAYYERLIAGQTPGRGQGHGEREVALRRTQEFARLFLAPGVGHCGGGAGPDSFLDGRNYVPFPRDIETWVEQGIAPEQLIAFKVANGTAIFSRPLCPYPALPRYNRAGDPTTAANFRCIANDDGDDNQPPAPRYVDDGQNYPIVPVEDEHRQNDAKRR